MEPVRQENDRFLALCRYEDVANLDMAFPIFQIGVFTHNYDLWATNRKISGISCDTRIHMPRMVYPLLRSRYSCTFIYIKNSN